MNSLVLARFLNRSFMIPYALKKCEKFALFLVEEVVFSALGVVASLFESAEAVSDGGNGVDAA